MTSRGEMALFDQLVLPDRGAEGRRSRAHQLLDQFFALCRRSISPREARRRGVAPMVLFVADPDDRARQGYAMLSDRFPDLPLVSGAQRSVRRSSAMPASFPPTRRGGAPVEHPGADAVLRSVDRPARVLVPRLCGQDTDTTAELYSWIRRIFLTFRELEVRALLGDVHPELRQSA